MKLSRRGVLILNLRLECKSPLQAFEGLPYSNMAFDGAHFYCCTGRSCKVSKLSLNGELVCCLDTKRIFCALCFDCAEKCFWAISVSNRSTVFKLNICMDEIGSINVPCRDGLYQDISYHAEDDMLLLCGGKEVVKLSKSGVLLPVYSGNSSAGFCATAKVYDNLLVGCHFQCDCPDIIGVLPPNCCFDYLACMPRGFALNSLCVGCVRGDGVAVFALATQNYRYAYLLNYRLECSADKGSCCTDAPCRDCAEDAQHGRQACQLPCETCDYFDTKERVCRYPTRSYKGCI